MDEYQYRIDSGSDTTAVQIEFKKIHRNSARYGKSVELQRAEILFGLTAEKRVSPAVSFMNVQFVSDS